MRIQEKNKFLTVAKHRAKKLNISWNGLPAFLKQETSLSNHFLFSIGWHVILIIILSILCATFKIHEKITIRPKNKPQDIEFILNNSSMPRTRQTAPAKTAGSKSESVATKTAEPTSKSKPVHNKKLINTMSHKNAIPDSFSIPMPKIKAMSSGGGIGRRTISIGGSSEGTASGIFSDDDGVSGSGSSKGGFDKNAAKKVVNAYDISPYVNELKRNIRMNWKAPKDEDNKYVELFLRIAKDGRIVILNVKKTSESGAVDEAALSAVRKTQPLSPLPSKYAKSYLDVIFTFNSDSSAIGSRH